MSQRKRADGLMEMFASGPEQIFCKSCGHRVSSESPTLPTPQMNEDGEPVLLSGVPSHLQSEFWNDDSEDGENA